MERKLDIQYQLMITLNELKCNKCNSETKTGDMWFTSSQNGGIVSFQIRNHKVCCDEFAQELTREAIKIMGSVIISSVE